MASTPREDAGVGHRAAGRRDDIEAFCGAEIIAWFFADGAQRSFGEEAGVFWICGCAFFWFEGLFGSRGRDRFFGLWRWLVGGEREAGEGEGSREFREEGFEGGVEALEGLVSF